ncbi:hypothetical protein AB9P05_17155 [Roseivirga sp. BDSF3-8]|uniref:hypothetical protein n=1 Tax=Roseivirga sp. BDSF3-8 TaxID=3241598 RepID=UPI0035324200
MKHFLIGLCVLIGPVTALGQSRSEALSDMQRLVQEIVQDEKTIEKNTERIAVLEADLGHFRQQKEEKLKEARQRLEDKKEEIENSESWKNRRETARKGYKEYNPGTCNAGGPPPICVVDHWYYVGYAKAMAEYEAYEKRELDKVRDNITNTDKTYSDKIADASDEIARLRQENFNLTNGLPGKRGDMGDAAYAWLNAVRKEDEEKEKKWQEGATREEAYRQVLDHNMGEIDNKLASANAEYLEAFSDTHDRLRERYNDNIDQIEDERYNTRTALSNHNFQSRMEADRLESAYEDALDDLQNLERRWQTTELPSEEDKKAYEAEKNRLASIARAKEKAHTDYVTQAKTKADNLQQKLNSLDAREQQLDAQYDQAGGTVEKQLKAAFENREKVLNQMKANTDQQIRSHAALMRQNKMMRQAEIDSWNKQKSDELSRMEDMCGKVDAICGAIYTPISYLPEADIDIVRELFGGLPGSGGGLEEFHDKILKLPAGIPNVTYKSGKDGTQTHFESKIGLARLINLKARFEQDPMNEKEGLTIKGCVEMEMLGKKSCFVLGTDKQTGENTYSLEGVIKENVESMRKIRRDQEEFFEKALEKVRKNKAK